MITGIGSPVMVAVPLQLRQLRTTEGPPRDKEKRGDSIPPFPICYFVRLLLRVEFDCVAGIDIFQREYDHGGR